MAPKSESPQNGEQHQTFLSEKETATPVTDFDDILPHLGEFGVYQKLLFLMMIPFAVTFAFVYFVQIFVTVTPQQYWCRVPELANLTIEHRRNLSIPPDVMHGHSRCQVYVANWSQVLQSGQGPDTSWETTTCRHGWEFNHSDIPYTTISTELEWVCERDSYQATAQAIFFVGAIVGGLLFGWMADRFGRIPALVGSNLIGFAGGIATIFSTNFWDFSFYRFLVGISFDNCFMMFYILVLEYVGPRYRTLVANMSIALFFGMACVALPWLALWVADWRRLLLVTSMPMLLVLLAPCLVPESARWLVSQGRVEDAVTVLRKFERINKTKIPEKLFDEFMESSKQTKGETKTSLMELFRRPLLRNMFLWLVTVYMGCAIVFDALVRLSDALGLDFFVTFSLTSATEMPSVTLVAFVLDRWGRRWLSFGPMMISGAFCLLAAFVPSGIPSVTLALVARFAINMSYNAAIQWAAELLPTPVRASGTALVHIAGYVATVISPFIVYLETVRPSLSLVVLAGVAAVGALAALPLPETAGRDMPRDLQAGERLMRVRATVPCRRPKDIELQAWSGTKEESTA